MKMDVSLFVLAGMYYMYKTVSYISNSADPDHISMAWFKTIVTQF